MSVWSGNDKRLDSGFTQKMLITLTGFVFVAAMAFFGWLATAVIDIRERVIMIETTAGALAEARTRETQHKVDTNEDRIDALEKDGR
jgi:hypothetical protein